MSKKRSSRSQVSQASKRRRKPVRDSVDFDQRRSLNLALELMAIPGQSGKEEMVSEYVTQSLRDAGAPSDAIQTDNAHRRTPINGQVGNLVFRLPGNVRAPRRLLMAHLDTVPICVGARPVHHGKLVRSADPATGLGADDRAGVAVVLSTALHLLKHKEIPHPPLTFLWPVQEEIGLHGARNVRLGLLGRPRLAFNFDGGSPAKLTIGATGGYRLNIEIHGRASHAGGAPEQGISAIAIAGLAIADLVNNGWHGLIHKGRATGTSNVGVITGGAATNVVTEQVMLKAEARSHDPRFRRRIVEAIEKAFYRAARTVRSADGAVGKVQITGQLDYESFCLKSSEPTVRAAEDAVRAEGCEPEQAISNGGLDANWMTQRGIPTVTLGCGQRNIHTVHEQLDVAEFQLACRIALRLATSVN